MYLSDDDARFDKVRAFMHRKYLYFRNILVQLNITSSTICREFVLEKVLSASSCPTCQGAGPAAELDIVHTCCRSIWSSRPVYSCQCCGCPHRSPEPGGPPCPRPRCSRHPGDGGPVQVVDDVRGGFCSSHVQEVDQGQVVGGEADSMGVELGVFDGHLVLDLDLGPPV